MNTQQLAQGIRLVDGHGGLAAVEVTTPAESGGSTTALTHLHGAHVADWTPAGGTPVLWVAHRSGDLMTDERAGTQALSEEPGNPIHVVHASAEPQVVCFGETMGMFGTSRSRTPVPARTSSTTVRVPRRLNSAWRMPPAGPSSPPT